MRVRRGRSGLARTVGRACVCAVLGALVGCVTTKDASNQLSRVAKDWCLTIRASQVMPVYPMTGDLEPGDVFLTTTELGGEIALFESKGFLPLDTHLIRLPVRPHIEAFYETRVADGTGFPHLIDTWDDVPGAAFPTYSFDIARGGGLNLAFPMQGVPVGLSLLGSGAASASVAIKEAETMGVDIWTLMPLVEEWRRTSEAQRILAAYGRVSSSKSPVFVRVVTRVYRAQSFDISLASGSGAGAAAAGGVALPAPEPGSPDASKPAAERYAELTRNLNAQSGAEFGASVKFVSVSQREVSMIERFTKPMIFGYIAYDCQILEGGALSAPMPTFFRVSGQPIAAPAQFDSGGLLTAWYTVDAARVTVLKDWISEHASPAPPSFTDFMTQDRWESDRWSAVHDLGVLQR